MTELQTIPTEAAVEWEEAHGRLQPLIKTSLSKLDGGEIIISTVMRGGGHSLIDGFFVTCETRAFGSGMPDEAACSAWMSYSDVGPTLIENSRRHCLMVHRVALFRLGIIEVDATERLQRELTETT